VKVQDAEQDANYQAGVTLASPPSPRMPAAQPSARTVARGMVRGWVTLSTALRQWDRPLASAIKGLALVVLLCAAVVLAAYAGILPMLPSTPPALQVIGATKGARVPAFAYCWLTPGSSACVDPGADVQAVETVPTVTMSTGATAQLRFSYPAPSACRATTLESLSGQGAATSSFALRTLAGGAGLPSATFRLTAPTTPGTYHVTIACAWNPHRSLRWLQGMGQASYALAVRVGAG
jgi:hypothetical protein